MSVDLRDIDIDVDILFRLKGSSTPSHSEQCQQLWLMAKSLERIGLDIQQWGIGDVSDSGGLVNTRAFTDIGPTDAAINSVTESPDIAEQSFSVWNGIEGQNGAALSMSYSLKNLSVFELKTEGLGKLYSSVALSGLLVDAVNIWPADVAQVGPYLYSQKKVFP